ncbi:MAG: outer membrane protein assembly factor BamA [Syntrophobacteraceae bacterium]
MSFQIFRVVLILFLLTIAWLQPALAAKPDPPRDTNSEQVRYIRFEGNHSFHSSEIKKVITTREKRFRWFSKAPLNKNVFEEDLQRIEKFYQSRGFYHVRILSHKIVPLVGREVAIEIQLEEGPPMMVSGVHLSVEGDTSGSWRDDLFRVMPLNSGRRFNSAGYDGIEKAVLQYFADQGYPKAHLDMKARLDKRTNIAEIWVEVRKGPVCYVGSIALEGNDTVADDIVFRELTFHTGERFSNSKILKSQQNLFNLDLFQFVDLIVDNMESDTTTLPIRILVKEAKKQTVRVGVGYGTEDDFRGQVQWEMRNFLGDGRRLQVNTKASSLVQFLEGKFSQPYLFDPRSSLTVDAGVRHEHQESFENEKVFVNPLVNYKWTEKLTSSAGYNLEANRLLNVDLTAPSIRPSDSENQNYYISSLVEGLQWSNVDTPLNPTEGVRLLQNLEWASVAFGSEVDFIKMTLEGRSYIPLNKYGVFAARLKWGGIQMLENTNDIPIFKRFFAGGSDSVRGYPYQQLGPLDDEGNPIGGLTLVEGSAEWRFPIRKPFEGVVFFDFGNVYERSFELVWDSLGYTAGCGLRYLTIVGPLRLDFGYQLNPPEHGNFDPYQVHFSIGQAF